MFPKAERQKTAGPKWFAMKAPDIDEKIKNDMELIRMRGVLDPKRFYKHNDRKALPKYFQVCFTLLLSFYFKPHSQE